MTNSRNGQRPDTETIIVLVLVGVFSMSAAVSFVVVESPMLTAFCMSLVATALLYRFLGGTEGSTLKVKTFKAGGSVAVFVFVMWFVNDKLLEQIPTIDPAPSSWLAINKNGASSEVKIGRKQYSHDVSEFLRDAVWGAELGSGLIRVTERENKLGKIELSSLDSLGLFDKIEMIQGRGVHYTDELIAGAEWDMSPFYSYKIQTHRYADSYNSFSLLDKHDKEVIRNGFLRTRNFQFVEHENKHFMIFVSRAEHNDPEEAPWAVFGFTQVNPTLNLK